MNNDDANADLYMAKNMKLLFIDMLMLLFLNSKTWFKMVFHL